MIPRTEELESHNEEYLAISQMFKNGGNQAKVKKILKIFNKNLWIKFQNEKTRLKRKNGYESPEILLFHGTSKTNPEQVYLSEEGFDPRFSSLLRNTYGQAVYFSDSSQYSGGFAYA